MDVDTTGYASRWYGTTASPCCPRRPLFYGDSMQRPLNRGLLPTRPGLGSKKHHNLIVQKPSCGKWSLIRIKARGELFRREGGGRVFFC